MADRRRMEVAVGQKVTFVSLRAAFSPPFEQVTSVSVVPVTSDGRLVATVLDRGVDVPGGHV